MSLPTPPTAGRPRRQPRDPILLERDARLESLKAVAGKLAHDFNNFLAPQYGYLTMLKDELAAGSSGALYVNSMLGAAQKSEAYIASILLGMRPYRQFSPREFAFGAKLVETLQQWSASTPANKQVRVISQVAPFTFCGDEKQWQMVFDHLLSNARFALAMGGELAVTLRREQLSGEEVQRLGLETDDVMRLTARDNGFGMPPEVVQRAFEPFYTTRTQVKALGLGLTLIHGIAQFHGGQVELHSAIDGGTTLTLWLPAGETGGYRPPSVMPTPPSPRRKKVLLIEDDPLIKEVLRSWLAPLNLDLEPAATEVEARRSLDRHKQDCVLVLSETDLPNAPGEDLLEKLGGIANAPWIFLKGSRQPVLPSPLPTHPLLVIQKPFSHSFFSNLIRAYTQQ